MEYFESFFLEDVKTKTLLFLSLEMNECARFATCVATPPEAGGYDAEISNSFIIYEHNPIEYDSQLG